MSLESTRVVRGFVALLVTGLVGCTVDVDNPSLSGPADPPTTTMTPGDEAGTSEGSTSSDPSGDPSDPTDPSGDPDSTTSEPTPANCGNGQLDADEDCDGNEFAGSCEDFGFDGGELTCNANCNVNTQLCFKCGNNQVEGDEACDGSNLGAETCKTLVPASIGGDLACTDDCSDFDTSGCVLPVCGDGMKNGNEACDGQDFGNTTCQSEGFGPGVLACNENCTSIDTSGCSPCAAQFGSCLDMPCCGAFMCFPPFGDEQFCI